MALSFLISPDDQELIGPDTLSLLARSYGELFTLPESSVELSLASVEEIRELNEQYRQIQEATDVLSFPTFSSLTELQQIPLGIPILLGSIIICPEKAVAYQETLPQLTHHGLLHLLGFDHETNLEQWTLTEQKILSTLSGHGLVIPSLLT